MANTLTSVLPKILAMGLMALREQAIMPRLVNRGYSTEAGQKGSTIDIPIPSAIAATDVTPSEFRTELEPREASDEMNGPAARKIDLARS